VKDPSDLYIHLASEAGGVPCLLRCLLKWKVSNPATFLISSPATTLGSLAAGGTHSTTSCHSA